MQAAHARAVAGVAEVTEVLDALRRIVQDLRKSSRAAESALGVSGAQLFVLESLSGEGTLSMNALAERTRTHQSTVSVVVKHLCARGLVQRTASELDGRRVELALSKRGRALLARAPSAAQHRLIAGIERLPSSERRALVHSLRALITAMQLDADAPLMFFEADRGGRKRKRGRRGAT